MTGRDGGGGGIHAGACRYFNPNPGLIIAGNVSKTNVYDFVLFMRHFERR